MVYRKENKNRRFQNGKIVLTNNCGSCVVIGQLNKTCRSRYIYFVVKFKDGTTVETTLTGLKSGSIKNPNCPSVCGVGYIGQGINVSTIGTKKPTREYKLWGGIIRRCYSEKEQILKPTYKGCTVDKRWHNFQNFCEDIKDIKGYDLWLTNVHGVQIDKDLKVKGNRVYSKDNCLFISRYHNNSESVKKHHSINN